MAAAPTPLTAIPAPIQAKPVAIAAAKKAYAAALSEYFPFSTTVSALTSYASTKEWALNLLKVSKNSKTTTIATDPKK